MKLSDLVYYRNNLDSIDINRVKQDALRELDNVRYVVAETGQDLHDYAKTIEQKFRSASDSIADLAQVLTNLRTHIDRRIEDAQDSYFAASTSLYQDDMCWETNDYILNRRLHIDDDSKIMLESRLKNCTDWRIPGMLIRPAKESFIEHLVPLDPLYLVDHDQELLDPALNSFNEVYRARLRPYVVSESQDQILSALPDGQFGLVFAYNFFNYKPYEVMQRWLQEIYHKLRPGGVVLFTFNDCDLGHGVALFESKFMCYTPKAKLIHWAERIGYDLNQEYRGQGDVSWLELKKPGEIASLRGSQPLAKILRK